MILRRHCSRKNSQMHQTCMFSLLLFSMIMFPSNGQGNGKGKNFPLNDRIESLALSLWVGSWKTQKHWKIWCKSWRLSFYKDGLCLFQLALKFSIMAFWWVFMLSLLQISMLLDSPYFLWWISCVCSSLKVVVRFQDNGQHMGYVIEGSRLATAEHGS